MKNEQKGVTLIALIVTIVIMLILLSVTTYVGTGSIENSKMTGFVARMQTIQGKVDIISQNEDYSKYGSALTSSNRNTLKNILNSPNENFITTSDSEALRYFDSQQIANDLEIENVDDEIVVDFNTREVISLKGVKYKDKMYYTQYSLPLGQTLIQGTETVERTVKIGDIIPNIKGLNATFTITNIELSNGTLSLGKIDSENNIKWSTITNYTKKGINVTTTNITESGTYYFKLVDNVTGKDNINEGEYPSIELRLTNEPKLQGNLTDLSPTYNYSGINKSENWAFATDKTNASSLVYYVWIPRFVYKLDGTELKELRFLRGVSDIDTSGNYLNISEWTMPSAFSSGKTGVWIKVNSGNQARHRYN